MWNARCAPLPESQSRDSGLRRRERGGFEPPLGVSAGTASAACQSALAEGDDEENDVFVPPSNGGESAVE